MQLFIESALYSASQFFMLPVLLAVIVMFIYSFFAVGQFLTQARQRRRGDPRGYDLLESWRLAASMSAIELETLAFKRLETPRIVTRVTPMLGLVATMIPMGPALKGLSNGQLDQVSDNLTVAFSAVILSLLAASLTYWVVNVRRRWYAEELVQIEQEQRSGTGAAAEAAHEMTVEMS